MPVHNSLFKALPSKRAFDEIADQIKDLIYSKTLKPGDKLPPERDLATQFGTGRMAVREALRILEIQGMVDIRHGKGAFVKSPSTDILNVPIEPEKPQKFLRFWVY